MIINRIFSSAHLKSRNNNCCDNVSTSFPARESELRLFTATLWVTHPNPARESELRLLTATLWVTHPKYNHSLPNFLLLLNMLSRFLLILYVHNVGDLFTLIENKESELKFI